jgi:MFS family permease
MSLELPRFLSSLRLVAGLAALHDTSFQVCNVPGNVLGTIISPDKALALGALTWGVASTAQAGCNNFAGVVVCRLFIGIGESAFGAAVPLYYGLWYRRDEIAVRISWYIGGGSLSGA